tara:strand:+ start:184 stop:699 length:516 start_codon:yes stop_codon:yes gene_type:complete
MIISTMQQIINKKPKITDSILKASAQAMLTSTHSCLNLYKIEGISEKINENKETYYIHLVPNKFKSSKYLEYILRILNPNINEILERFIACLAVNLDVVKAFDYEFDKLNNCLRGSVELEYKASHFLIKIDKKFIKQIYILCPLSNSLDYLINGFNLALYKSLNQINEGKK